MTYQYLNTIDSHSCIFFFNTLKNLVKILGQNGLLPFLDKLISVLPFFLN